MSPILLFTRVTGLALLTAVGGYLLIKKLTPQPSDLAAAAIHFRNGFQEFQRGVETMVFGGGPSEAEIEKQRESRRIPID
jgi:hypothetical protein